MRTKEFVVYCFSLYMTACSGYRPLFEIPRSSLTLDNVQGEEQPLQTGFLVGTTAESTSRIEIALDGGSYEAATGTTSWRYPLPLSARRWRLNSTHMLNIRAVNSAGNTVAELSRRIKKDHNRDLNGDGYPEIGVAASGYGSSRSRVYAYFGGTNSLQNLSKAIVEGDVANDNCWNHTIADLDLDGYADLIIGCSMNLGTGRVGIFYGNPNFSGARLMASAETVITGGPSEEFSFVKDTSDFNGDGYPDLAVGAANYNSYDGKLYIFYGSASRWNSMLASSAQTILTGVAADSGYGSYAGGDINGDGYDDLVSTSYDFGGGNGRVYIFYGQSTFITSGLSTSANRIIDGEGISAYFGSHPLVADINGDGFGDVIIGAPRNNIATSKTYIFYGAASGISTTLAGSANTIITGESNSALGNPLVGAVTGNGKTDLLIGGPKWNNNDTGKLILLRQQASPITSANASTVTEFMTGNATGLRFGTAQVLWYRNGSSNPLLCVSGYGANSSRGSVFLYENIQSKIFPGSSVAADLEIMGENTGDAFGLAMAGSP